jgi:predicted transcriptional regulator
MMIYYTDEKENKLFDFTTLKQILKVNKSKLYRELNKLSNVEVIRYKNQNLYPEKTLYLLMKEKLLERLRNEFRED